MKIINPSTTIILASHLKPDFLPTSLDSILKQTRNDIQIIVADSGAWLGDKHPMENVYQVYHDHPLIEWVTLNQQWPTPLRERACPYTWVWNRILESDIVQGRYLSFFTDDDLYRPQFVERMAGFLDTYAPSQAVYCAQDRARIDTYGSEEPAGPILSADAPIDGPGFLMHVDMIQMMFRRRVLDRLERPWFDENPQDDLCRCADGRFMNRIGELGPVANIPEILCTHRYTAHSLYN